MREIRARSRRGALGLAVLALCAAPAFGFALGALPALSQLERGRWTVRDLDAGRDRLSVCLGDPADFVQLEHRGLRCEHELLASDARGGTVQYRCPGRGFGHTSVKVETPRLARIDTQGLINGRPFSYRAEARRVAAC
jgi:hypothetical protein